jgi:hypothetical protein
MCINETACIWSVVHNNLVGPDSQWFWTMVAGLAAAIGLGFIYQQIRLQVLGTMMNTLATFNDRWKSAEMVTARKNICEHYLGGGVCSPDSAEKVAGFFEEMGLYTERKVLDSAIVWELYGQYVESYWAILLARIEELRKLDETAYRCFQRLNKRALSGDRKEGILPQNVSADQLRRFANSEIAP